RTPTEDEVQEAFNMTDGWAAGLVLLAAQPGGFEKALQTKGLDSSAAIFDYFAVELLSQIDAEHVQLLAAASFFPSFSAAMAGFISGQKDAESALTLVERDILFVQRLSGQGHHYHFHPLFHAFLKQDASRLFSSEKVRDLQIKAAGILRKEGRDIEAAELYIEAADFESIRSLIQEKATHLLNQSRWPTLERWLRALPEDYLDADPWLRYWLGLCLLPNDTAAARLELQKAYRKFFSLKNRSAAYLAWARIVESISLESGSFAEFDQWLVEYERLRTELGAIRSVEALVRSTVARFNALLYRRPDDSDLKKLEKRIRKMMLAVREPTAQVALGAQLIRYYTWTGDLGSARSILQRLRPVAERADIEPFAQAVFASVDAVMAWLDGTPAAGLKVANEALEIAKDRGVGLVIFSILSQGAYSALALGDLSRANEFIEQMPETFKAERQVDMGHFLYFKAWAALLEGEKEKALDYIQNAVETFTATGVPYIVARGYDALGHFHYLAGNYDEARESLERSVSLSIRNHFDLVKLNSQYSLAELHYQLGEAEQGDALLKEAMAFGARRSYAGMPHWIPGDYAVLCARALEKGFEPDYVRLIIAKHDLQPPKDVGQFWPWPIRVKLLGDLQIQEQKNNKMVKKKLQGKPLELLAALVAFGGKRVSENLVGDALWPDVDGDRIHANIKTTVARLRSVLGSKSLEVSDGVISINSRHIWVDALYAQERACEGPADKNGEQQYFAALLECYRGPFWAQDQHAVWASGMRRNLQSKIANDLEKFKISKQENGDLVIQTLEKLLERDPLGEPFAQALITRYAAMGERDKALAFFDRFQANLQSYGLGEVSPALMRIQKDLLK
ncbi:hypothetical protein KAI87_02325, partial [Myxococcota bacterium]|nr:hypothetical protein [Myxococcota bacterium]